MGFMRARVSASSAARIARFRFGRRRQQRQARLAAGIAGQRERDLEPGNAVAGADRLRQRRETALPVARLVVPSGVDEFLNPDAHVGHDAGHRQHRAGGPDRQRRVQRAAPIPPGRRTAAAGRLMNSPRSARVGARILEADDALVLREPDGGLDRQTDPGEHRHVVEQDRAAASGRPPLRSAG